MHFSECRLLCESIYKETRTHLRLIDNASINGADFECQIMQMALHRIRHHPEGDQEGVDEQQAAHEQN